MIETESAPSLKAGDKVYVRKMEKHNNIGRVRYTTLTGHIAITIGDGPITILKPSDLIWVPLITTTGMWKRG